MKTRNDSGTVEIDVVDGSLETEESGCPLLSRRQFLRSMAAGAAAVAATGAASRVLASSGTPGADADEIKPVGMLIDLTRCTGCNSCALACKVANNKPNPTTVPTGLTYDSLSYVDTRNVVDARGAEVPVHVKVQCMHCLHPACVSACTVGALKKTKEGPVVYDGSKCIGCRYCQYACPFGLPVYDWDNPLGLIGKCEMCVQLQAQGETPACAAACPNGAIRFGKRDELLAQAHAQIQSNPGRYVNHIYGEHEAGGASFLYLAPADFTALGFPVVGEDEIPRYAEFVMKKTPYVAVTVAALATAIQFITRQRHGHQEFTPTGSQVHAHRDEEH